jgi:hypothetical protein
MHVRGDDAMTRLIAMGVTELQAADALAATRGGTPETHAQAALELLLSQNPEASTRGNDVNRGGGWMSSIGNMMSSAASAAGQAIASAKSKFKWKGAAMDM